jgi:hypothetical protein
MSKPSFKELQERKIAANRERLRKQEAQLGCWQVTEFILAWQAQYGSRKVNQGDLRELAIKIPDMADFDGWGQRSHNLDRLLLRLRVRVYDRWTLRVGGVSGSRVYWLQEYEPGGKELS